MGEGLLGGLPPCTMGTRFPPPSQVTFTGSPAAICASTRRCSSSYRYLMRFVPGTMETIFPLGEEETRVSPSHQGKGLALVARSCRWSAPGKGARRGGLVSEHDPRSAPFTLPFWGAIQTSVIEGPSPKAECCHRRLTPSPRKGDQSLRP